jgi:hypothetical protein
MIYKNKECKVLLMDKIDVKSAMKFLWELASDSNI